MLCLWYHRAPTHVRILYYVSVYALCVWCVVYGEYVYGVCTCVCVCCV